MTNFINFAREFREAKVDGAPSAELAFRPESPADYKLLNSLAHDPLSDAPRDANHPSTKYRAILEWISEPIPGTSLSRRTLVVRVDTSTKIASDADKIASDADETTDDAPLPKPLETMTKPELLEFAAVKGIAVQPEWPLKKMRDEIAKAGATEE